MLHLDLLKLAEKGPVITQQWRVLFVRVRIREYSLLEFELESTRSTTIFASISISRRVIPNCAAMVSPSLSAQNLAMTLVVIPIFQAKPWTQLPLWSRMTPPPPALPGFPIEAPSMLSLCQPILGLFHFSRMQPCCRGWTDFPTQKKYSIVRLIQDLWSERFRVVFSKTTMFLCFHNPQTAKGNNQSNQFELKEEIKKAGTPIFLQNSMAKRHSLNKWLIDSVPFLHRGQVVSHCTPLAAMTPLACTLLLWHNHKKCAILGIVSISQTHLPRNVHSWFSLGFANS